MISNILGIKSMLLMGIFIDKKQDFFGQTINFFDAKMCILNTILGRYLSVTLDIHKAVISLNFKTSTTSLLFF